MNINKTIFFNEYINKVGIEFEGLFKQTLFDELGDNLRNSDPQFDNFHSDGSISGGYSNEIAYELITRPLGEDDLNTVIDRMADYQNNKLYRLNSSTGLHFHVSLNKCYYAYIDNKSFFDKFVEMFKKVCPEVYKERKESSYCRFQTSDNHFSLSSPSRYTAVNYCYKKHGTVEFRAYGGSKATIIGLAEVINKTLALIKEEIEYQEDILCKSENKNVEIEESNDCKARVRKFEYKREIVRPREILIRKIERPKNESVISFKSLSIKKNIEVDITYN